MMRNGWALTVLVGTLLVGCGGAELAPEEPLASVEGALVTCSASCPTGSSVSCSGNACSAANNSYVQCDGQYVYCPTAPQPNCQQFQGSSYDSSEDACANANQLGTQYCASYGGVKSRQRLCLISANGPPYRASNYICCNQ